MCNQIPKLKPTVQKIQNDSKSELQHDMNSKIFKNFETWSIRLRISSSKDLHSIKQTLYQIVLKGSMRFKVTWVLYMTVIEHGTLLVTCDPRTE